MKAFIKLFAMTFLLLTFLASENLKAQDTPKAATIQIEKTDVEKEKEKYTRFLDSILLEEDYKKLADLAERLKLKRVYEYSQISIPYLITAYYFLGNEERSNELLSEKINKLNYGELVDLLTSSNTAFIKYFNVPSNREPIISLAIKDYIKNEKATDKVAGEQIIRFLIQDQMSRKINYAYKQDDSITQVKIYQEFRREDSIQNAQVYAFYKEHNKYFNQEEVGKTVSWYQPIILSHYDNIELRQTFFKELLQKAVQHGRIEKTNYVHFLLRTESFTNPDFFKNLEKRIEEVRREYDLPDYLWNPF